MNDVATKPSERAIAFHEAGHAVAAYKLKRRMRKVSVIPDDEALGRVSFLPLGARLFEPGVDAEPWLRRMLEREIVVTFAGPVAEERFTGILNDEGATNDFHSIGDNALRLYSPEDYREGTSVARLEAEARQIIEENWSAVIAVAGALVEHKSLGVVRVRQIIRAALKE